MAAEPTGHLEQLIAERTARNQAMFRDANERMRDRRVEIARVVDRTDRFALMEKVGRAGEVARRLEHRGPDSG
ncbi:MAG TPA: hypothetical protein VFU56_07305 [Gaiellaceae bacterium]|nr:hypothetical protein [Gaiellaceae bacterium]